MNEGEQRRQGRLGGVIRRLGVQGIWQAHYQDDKHREIRVSTRTTDETKALKFLEQRRRDVIAAEEDGIEYEAPRLKRIKISDCLDIWRRERQLQNKWSDTYQSDEKQLRERFGNLRIDQLTKSVIMDYQSEEKQGLDPKRSLGRNAKLNRHVDILCAAIKATGATPAFAKQRKSLVLPSPEARQGFFTPQQFRLLHAALPPDIADVCEFLWLTGWRRSECCGKVVLGIFRAGVLWSECEGDSLMIPGQRTKGRRAKRIPLTGQLLELIQKRERLKVPGSDLIFHRGDGRPVGHFSAAWKTACIAAGRPGALIHDLRRSRARNWIRSGVPEKTCMEMGGWATRQIFDRYNIVSENDMIRAQEQTEKYLQQQLAKEAETKQISRAVN